MPAVHVPAWSDPRSRSSVCPHGPTHALCGTPHARPHAAQDAWFNGNHLHLVPLVPEACDLAPWHYDTYQAPQGVSWHKRGERVGAMLHC